MHVLNYNKILSHMYPLMSSVIAYLYCCWLYCIVGYLLHPWTCFEWHTLYYFLLKQFVQCHCI